ncbi:hypothetical protein GobsT_36470 [Gemmata obscuriglobus]|uniref:Uncharacterized protein n=1 Tax=Gemmata obscuriglobus TaxID=114 RepID=A0A2Z3H3R8_9BACT|nr:hypothetical protein [Gemmata obscuriglobus]AWM38236.1 hypothetical protein C1280_15405 [Gemmata obscuriglobus]QEG28859.1 hypothetical protein GobsT_36470 [Gemmata obscuriglobus]VTS07289.1 unnamed protein product [Gemmata obscuriglobus UQM 2246]
MNTNSPESVDALDALLSDFFKAQLRTPWPKAPVAPVPVVPSEVARAAAAPVKAPSVPARARDNAARARFTLAASVALLMGTGWFLASGVQSGPNAGRGAAPDAGGLKFLPDSGASGHDHIPLKKMGEDKAKGNEGIKIDVSGIE